MNAEKEFEHIIKLCLLCNGQTFPLGVRLPIIPKEMLQHINEDHLPLRCDVCLKVYKDLNDLKNVDICCKTSVSIVESVNVVTEATVHTEAENILTPLSKINMRWRRKSKDLKHSGMLKVPGDKIQRTTSTPLQNNFLMTKTFIDSSSNSTSSSIHISSINCHSSSSESDGFSPPVAPPVKVAPIPVSPKMQQNTNRSRAKLIQATPLRQVMTKSIQRAIQQYQQTPFALQQRKMSFSSSNSSNEASLTSTSLMKFPVEGESPLDLRLSPAIRRFKSVTTSKTIEIAAQCHTECEGEISHHEHIEVIIRRSEIKSDSSAMSSYKSCYTDSGRSGSMPETHFTPKLSGNNFLKKTISFGAPETIEQTPSILMQAYNENKNDDDEVFYTPRSPIRAQRRISPVDGVLKPDNKFEESGDSLPRHSIWNFVKNVVKVARRTSEDIGETFSNSEKIWKINFIRPEFVKKAAGLFKSHAKNFEVKQPMKRRRTSSNCSRSSSQTSPAVKRQKIQARRPISQMRKLTHS